MAEANLVHNASGERMEVPGTEKITLSCSTEYKEYTYNESHDIWTLVSLKAPSQEDNEEDEKRASIDVVAVIDKSGSMSGTKLDLVKKTLEFVLTQLSDRDRLSIVTYDTNVYVDYKLKKMTKDNKTDALEKIRNISSGSSTNLCGGLMKGLCQIVDRGDDKSEVASVLLFTDGLANQGITSAAGIMQAMKDPKKYDGPSSNAEKSHPRPQQAPHHSWLKNVFGGKTKQQEQPEPEPAVISVGGPADASVYTFGFGEDHDPDMLKGISDAGNGMYYFIENADKIAESFGHCLGGLLSTIAQGIQLEIVMEEGVTIKEVHSGRPFVESTDKKSVKVNMGDLQSEENRDVVLELTLAAVNAPYETTPQPLLNAVVNYFNVVSNNLEDVTEKLNVIRTDKPVVHDGTNANVRLNKQRARVKMTRAMKSANEKADEGDIEGARDMMLKEIDSLRSSRPDRAAAIDDEEYEDVNSGYNNMIDDMQNCSDNLTSAHAWRSKGKHLQMNLMQQHTEQRSSNLDSAAYATKGKERRKRAAKSFVKK